MNIQTDYLVFDPDPEKIKNLSSEEKTQLYIRLKDRKEQLSKKITEQKARKELLEKKKEEIQTELFTEANVSSMEDLIAYVKKLQEEFDKALEEETILVSDAMAKLNLR